MTIKKLIFSALAVALAFSDALPYEPVHYDATRSQQWHIQALQVVTANKISTGEGIIVGVVDTGVSPHQDLKSNLLAGIDVVPGGNSKGTADQDGHGTAMASLIAAHGRSNKRGVIGIAPKAKILPVKTAAQENAGPDQFAAGIERAIVGGARVINISASMAPSIGLADSIADSAAADIVVIAGVGNFPRMRQIGYPAATAGVLAVGATDAAGNHAEISVVGQEVQLCAPGVDIVMAAPGNKYAEADGTSASTAIVSGAAALVRAKFPDLTAPQVIQRLTATADDIGPPGRDDECGFGVLNIVKALTADVPTTGGSSAPPSGPASSAAEPSNAASPGSDSPGINLLAVAGGIVGVVLVGGLIGVLALRRRQRS